MTVPGRKLDVELVELVEGDDAALLGDDVDPGPPAPREPWSPRRLLRAWPLAVVALVVAGIYAVADARERAALERLQEALGGQAGFIEDLSAPLRPLWSTADLGRGDFHPLAAVGDTVILQSYTVGEQGIVAVNAATGEERWALASEADGARACLTPVLEEYESGPAVVCTASSTDSGRWMPVVEHRDAATGELLATSEELTAGAELPTRELTPWGAGLAQVVVDDGATTLRRTDLAGNVAWSTTVLEHELGPADFFSLYTHGDLAMIVVGPRALVVDAGGRVVVDHVFDAEPIELSSGVGDFVGPEAYYGYVVPLPGGGFAAVSGTGEGRTWLYDAEGVLRVEQEGMVISMALDDGSLGSTVLVSEPPDLVLVDLATGAQQRRIEDLRQSAGLVVDGAIVVSGPLTLSSIDAESGEQRWSVDVVGDIVGSDGAAVLLSERDGYTTLLRAFDLDSGRELWSAPVDLTNAWLLPIAGSVYLIDGTGLVRFGS